MSKAESISSASASNDSITSESGVKFSKPPRPAAAAEGDGGISFIRLGNLAEGDTVVEGIFIGTSQNTMYPEKLDFKFKTSDDKTVIWIESDVSPCISLIATYSGMKIFKSLADVDMYLLEGFDKS